MSTSAAPNSNALVDEIVHQWTAAVRRMTAGSPALESAPLPGITAIWANVTLPVYNQALLSRPVADLDELRARLDGLMAFASERGKPWMFTPCHAWLPPGSDEVIASHGLVPGMPLTGMIADRIEPAPESKQHNFRALSGREGSRLVGDLNCAAYGMPAEWAAETDWPSFFGNDAFSYALYENGTPASTATAFAIDGCLNVVCVATLPPFQRKGYAEAVLRHTLEDASRASGITRTVLHASRAGYPIYERMGYRPVAEFTAWTLPH